MAIIIKKGGSTSLDVLGENLRNLSLVLSWTERKSSDEEFDLDLSVIMAGAGTNEYPEGKSFEDRDVIYYNGFNRSICNSIHHHGDEKKGGEERIDINLETIPDRYIKLVAVATIYEAEERKQNFGQVLNGCIRLINRDNNKEIQFDLSEDSNTATKNTLVFSEIYKYQDQWKYKSVGRGINGGLKEFVTCFGLKSR
ncbi:TerD family protein [Methylomonas sp. AM2-LC]|uniref:TerD family protein n=1 Tax=Methylomonas sp. AM2-LC TaxID=3153301 RepID=UPI003265354E